MMAHELHTFISALLLAFCTVRFTEETIGYRPPMDPQRFSRKWARPPGPNRQFLRCAFHVRLLNNKAFEIWAGGVYRCAQSSRIPSGSNVSAFGWRSCSTSATRRAIFPMNCDLLPNFRTAYNVRHPSGFSQELARCPSDGLR